MLVVVRRIIAMNAGNPGFQFGGTHGNCVLAVVNVAGFVYDMAGSFAVFMPVADYVAISDWAISNRPTVYASVCAIAVVYACVVVVDCHW